MPLIFKANPWLLTLTVVYVVLGISFIILSWKSMRSYARVRRVRIITCIIAVLTAPAIFGVGHGFFPLPVPALVFFLYIAASLNGAEFLVVALLTAFSILFCWGIFFIIGVAIIWTWNKSLNGSS